MEYGFGESERMCHVYQNDPFVVFGIGKSFQCPPDQYQSLHVRAATQLNSLLSCKLRFNISAGRRAAAIINMQPAALNRNSHKFCCMLEYCLPAILVFGRIMTLRSVIAQRQRRFSPLVIKIDWKIHQVI